MKNHIKILSVFLSLIIAVGVFTIVPVSVFAAPNGIEYNYYDSYTVDANTPYTEDAVIACGGSLSDTKTILFNAPIDWANEYNTFAGPDDSEPYMHVCIYWWSGTGSEWPNGNKVCWVGYQAHLIDKTQWIYSAQVPKDVPLVIWNNGVNGGMDTSNPKFEAARQLQEINIEDEDGEGCILSVDKTNVQYAWNGAEIDGSKWYFYYGNGCYGSIKDYQAHGGKYACCENPNHHGVTGDCTWTIENSLLTISGSGDMDNYNKKPVRTNGSGGVSYADADEYDKSPWSYLGGITKAVIGNGVTNVGQYAFYKNKELKDVSIGNAVEGIGSYAFSNCEKLGTIALPNSVTVIGEEAFSHCSALSTVTIPDSVTDIGSCAFLDCPSLKSITIPDSVTHIDAKAFGYCRNERFGLYVKDPGFTIYGNVGSEAQRYAKTYGFTFERAVAVTGDADGDCAVTLMDVTEVQHTLSLIETGSDDDVTKYTDIDENGLLEIVDATWIQRYVADMDIPYVVGKVTYNG